MSLDLSLLLVVSAFVALSGATQPQCPSGWTPYADSCYYVGQDVGFTFEGARGFCESQDSLLAWIDSESENDYVKSLLQNDDAPGAWIGLRKGYTNKWGWVRTGSNKQDPTVTDWVSEDDAGRDVDYMKTNCASLSKDNGRAWEVKDCDVPDGQKFVCESGPLQQVCSARTCFRLLSSREEFEDAGPRCESLGGQLATVRSQEESDLLRNFLSQATLPPGIYTFGVWIGGVDDDTGIWRWTTPERENITGYTDWADGEPDNSGRGGRHENCLGISMEKGWQWQDRTCILISPILCEINEETAITG